MAKKLIQQHTRFNFSKKKYTTNFKPINFGDDESEYDAPFVVDNDAIAAKPNAVQPESKPAEQNWAMPGIPKGVKLYLATPEDVGIEKWNSGGSKGFGHWAWDKFSNSKYGKSFFHNGSESAADVLRSGDVLSRMGNVYHKSLFDKHDFLNRVGGFQANKTMRLPFYYKIENPDPFSTSEDVIFLPAGLEFITNDKGETKVIQYRGDFPGLFDGAENFDSNLAVRSGNVTPKDFYENWGKPNNKDTYIDENVSDSKVLDTDNAWDIYRKKRKEAEVSNYLNELEKKARENDTKALLNYHRYLNESGISYVDHGVELDKQEKIMGTLGIPSTDPNRLNFRHSVDVPILKMFENPTPEQKTQLDSLPKLDTPVVNKEKLSTNTEKSSQESYSLKSNFPKRKYISNFSNNNINKS